ncbi:bacterial SH3 domain protein [mine drainage metagenome]|uniref:Bacterial SH3 domain protein n=1 Tax=mine drainage metagenome TaxID=410659 RepID=A0A1J5R2C5_9ZZZZ
MRSRIKYLFVLPVLMLPAVAWAADFRSVSVPRAVLLDAPSVQAKKLFIVGQSYPVEVIVNLGDWLKVRDSGGGLAWIAASQLSAKRSVVVTAAQAEVREAADDTSRLVFRAEKDVVLQLLETGTNGWAKVSHRDGLAGYVQVSKVWGL